MNARFNCDQLIGQDIHGWGVVNQPDSAPARPETDFLIVLKAGGTAIGQQRRTIPRPDADKAAGQSGVVKGFRMPVLAPAAVLIASTMADPLPLTLSFAGIEVALWKQPGRLLDLSEFRSLKFADPDGPVKVADVWFASEREIRFRVDKIRNGHGHSPPYTIRFFQPEFSPGLRLVQVGESTVGGDGVAFVSQFLRNPLLPLLIVVCASNGDAVAMDAIPFPSLCRGGLNHAELLSLQAGAGYIEDLRAMNDTLLREIWDAPSASKAAQVNRIEIDFRGATGAERILSADMLQWLSLARGIEVSAISLKEDEAAADPEADDGLLGTAMTNAGLSVSANGSKRKTGFALKLPADAIPTLSVVLSRRLGSGGESDPAATTFLTANAVTGVPQWFVSLPPLSSSLVPLQPLDQPALQPIISPGGKGKSKPSPSLLPGPAAAIRFVDESFRSDDQRLMPLAADIEQILAPSAEDSDDPLVSVVVSVRNGAAAVRDFVASLAAQTLAPRIELVIVNNRSFSNPRSQIEQAASAHFEGRYKIIDADHPFNLSALTNAGVEAATGTHVVLASPDVILHDPRTIATLATLASTEPVAFAGCMLLQPKSANSDGIRFLSAGVFPTAMIFGGQPRVEFSEPDCGAVFGTATYPVAAVSFALACVRRATWQDLGGLDETRLAGDLGDVDLGVRALAAGHVNVCTTAVSAFHQGRMMRGQSFDVLAPGRLTPLSLADALAKCTVMRRLV